MPLNKIIKNYYNGRPDQPDFKKEDLPADRLNLFAAILKVRFFNLFGLNVLYILSWLLPGIWAMQSVSIVLNTAVDNVIDPASLILSIAVFSVLMIITGPADMGIAYVTREWARDRHADRSDLWRYMKKYFGLGLLHSLVYSVFFLASMVSIILYLVQFNGSIISYIPIIIVLTVFILGDLASMLMPMMLITYENRFFVHFKNALSLTIIEFPRAILIRLATLALPIAVLVIPCFIPDSFNTCCSVLITLYICLLPAFNKLIIASYANYVCEKHINPMIGESTRIGLRPDSE